MSARPAPTTTDARFRSIRSRSNCFGTLPLLCRFLGRLHDVAIHVRRRQASEKRQGTKSRLVGSGGCSRLYGDLAAAGVAGMAHWGTGLGGSGGQQGVGGQLDERKGRRGVGRRLL